MSMHCIRESDSRGMGYLYEDRNDVAYLSILRRLIVEIVDGVLVERAGLTDSLLRPVLQVRWRSFDDSEGGPKCVPHN